MLGWVFINQSELWETSIFGVGLQELVVHIMILIQSFLKSRLRLLFTALNLTQSLFLNVGSLVYSIYALVVFINLLISLMPMPTFI